MASTHDFFAFTHTGNQALAAASTRIDLLDVGAGTVVTTGLEIGECPHFSPDDTMFLYMANEGKQLMIRGVAAGSPSTPIRVKANFSSADWRN